MGTRSGRLAEYRRKRDFSRTREPASRQEQWLLIKHRHETADPDIDPTEAYQTSVRTGRSMDGIAKGQRKRRA